VVLECHVEVPAQVLAAAFLQKPRKNKRADEMITAGKPLREIRFSFYYHHWSRTVHSRSRSGERERISHGQVPTLDFFFDILRTSAKLSAWLTASHILSNPGHLTPFPKTGPGTMATGLRGLRRLPPAPGILYWIHTRTFFFFRRDYWLRHCARECPHFRRASSELHRCLVPLGQFSCTADARARRPRMGFTSCHHVSTPSLSV